MDDLIAFLNARLNEDEQTAKRCVTDSGSHLNGGDPLRLAVWSVTDRPATGTFVATRDQWDRTAEIVPTYGGMHADHIARHDPARVLAEVDAKRRIIELHTDATGHSCSVTDETGYHLNYGEVTGQEACTTLRLLALPYAPHPDYQAAWRP